MKRPTDKQLARMEHGFKFVGVDLCTPDQKGGRFRYHLDAWNEPQVDVGLGFSSGHECPQWPGDGLCVATTLAGAQSGGQRVGSSVMLLVGYLPEDVLGGSAESGKVRVRRLYVDPDPVDPVALLVWAAADGANLWGANLWGANLWSADLRSADLRGANLWGANLWGANLWGANLWGANLGSANLGSANLGSANLWGANLRSANLRSANLGSANLGSADLRSADLRGANLGSANLGSADLRSANLWGANLRSANLGSANLGSANLWGANLRSAIGDRYTTLPTGWTVCDGRVVRS